MCFRWPWVIILLAGLLCGLCSIGFLKWREETDGLVMWVPEESPFRLNKEWLDRSNTVSARGQSVLIKAKPGKNVLTAKDIQTIFEFREALEAVKTNDTAEYNGASWQELCLKVPGPTIGKF